MPSQKLINKILINEIRELRCKLKNLNYYGESLHEHNNYLEKSDFNEYKEKAEKSEEWVLDYLTHKTNILAKIIDEITPKSKQNKSSALSTVNQWMNK